MILQVLGCTRDAQSSWFLLHNPAGLVSHSPSPVISMLWHLSNQHLVPHYQESSGPGCVCNEDVTDLPSRALKCHKTQGGCDKCPSCCCDALIEVKYSPPLLYHVKGVVLKAVSFKRSVCYSSENV